MLVKKMVWDLFSILAGRVTAHFVPWLNYLLLHLLDPIGNQLDGPWLMLSSHHRLALAGNVLVSIDQKYA